MSHAVAIAGAFGKMGQIAQKAIASLDHFHVSACIGRDDDLIQGMAQADLIIDLTLPTCVYQHAQLYLAHHKRMLIGTSGLSAEQITALQTQARNQQIGGIIAPNFSIGAVLMMQAAAHWSQHFPTAMIHETHHREKRDAPSATALKTATMMAANAKDIPIHSTRIDGCLAEQTVCFGNLGESLRVEHRMLNREGFIPGIQWATQQAMRCHDLHYGLESLLRSP